MTSLTGRPINEDSTASHRSQLANNIANESDGKLRCRANSDPLSSRSISSNPRKQNKRYFDDNDDDDYDDGIGYNNAGGGDDDDDFVNKRTAHASFSPSSSNHRWTKSNQIFNRVFPSVLPQHLQKNGVRGKSDKSNTYINNKSNKQSQIDGQEEEEEEDYYDNDYDNLDSPEADDLQPPRLSLVLEERPSELDSSRSISDIDDDEIVGVHNDSFNDDEYEEDDDDDSDDHSVISISSVPSQSKLYLSNSAVNVSAPPALDLNRINPNRNKSSSENKTDFVSAHDKNCRIIEKNVTVDPTCHSHASKNTITISNQIAGPDDEKRGGIIMNDGKQINETYVSARVSVSAETIDPSSSHHEYENHGEEEKHDLHASVRVSDRGPHLECDREQAAKSNASTSISSAQSNSRSTISSSAKNKEGFGSTVTSAATTATTGSKIYYHDNEEFDDNNRNFPCSANATSISSSRSNSYTYPYSYSNSTKSISQTPTERRREPLLTSDVSDGSANFRSGIVDESKYDTYSPNSYFSHGSYSHGDSCSRHHQGVGTSSVKNVDDLTDNKFEHNDSARGVCRPGITHHHYRPNNNPSDNASFGNGLISFFSRHKQQLDSETHGPRSSRSISRSDNNSKDNCATFEKDNNNRNITNNNKSKLSFSNNNNSKSLLSQHGHPAIKNFENPISSKNGPSDIKDISPTFVNSVSCGLDDNENNGTCEDEVIHYPDYDLLPSGNFHLGSNTYNYHPALNANTNSDINTNMGASSSRQAKASRHVNNKVDDKADKIKLSDLLKKDVENKGIEKASEKEKERDRKKVKDEKKGEEKGEKTKKIARGLESTTPLRDGSVNKLTLLSNGHHSSSSSSPSSSFLTTTSYPHRLDSSCAPLHMGGKNADTGQRSTDKKCAHSLGEKSGVSNEEPILQSTKHATKSPPSETHNTTIKTLYAAKERPERAALTRSSEALDVDYTHIVEDDNVERVTITSPSYSNTYKTNRENNSETQFHEARSTDLSGYADIISLNHSRKLESEGKNGSPKHDLVVIYSKPIPKELRTKPSSSSASSSLNLTHSSIPNYPTSEITSLPQPYALDALAQNGNLVSESSNARSTSDSNPNSVVITPPPAYSTISVSNSTSNRGDYLFNPLIPNGATNSHNIHSKSEEHLDPRLIDRVDSSNTNTNGLSDDYDNPVGSPDVFVEPNSTSYIHSNSQRSETSHQNLNPSFQRYGQYQHRPPPTALNEFVHVQVSTFSDCDRWNDKRDSSCSSLVSSTCLGDSPGPLSAESQFHSASDNFNLYASDAETDGCLSNYGRHFPHRSASSSRVHVRCQIKKSSTADGLDTTDYDNKCPWLPTPSSSNAGAGFGYYSLDRRQRPNRSNAASSRHSGRTVSLEQLLRYRRHTSSSSSVPRTPSTPLENLSVDDILKTCSEYEEEDEVFSNGRSTSQSSRKSSFSQASFRDALSSPLVTGDDESLTSRHTSSTSLASQVNSTPTPSYSCESGSEMERTNFSSAPITKPSSVRHSSNPILNRVFMVSGIRIVPIGYNENETDTESDTGTSTSTSKIKPDISRSQTFDYGTYNNHWPYSIKDKRNSSSQNDDVPLRHSYSQPSLNKGATGGEFKYPNPPLPYPHPSISRPYPHSHSHSQSHSQSHQGVLNSSSSGWKTFNYSPRATDIVSPFTRPINQRLDTIVSVEEDESIIKNDLSFPPSSFPHSSSPHSSSNFSSTSFSSTPSATITTSHKESYSFTTRPNQSTGQVTKTQPNIHTLRDENRDQNVQSHHWQMSRSHSQSTNSRVFSVTSSTTGSKSENDLNGNSNCASGTSSGNKDVNPKKHNPISHYPSHNHDTNHIIMSSSFSSPSSSHQPAKLSINGHSNSSSSTSTAAKMSGTTIYTTNRANTNTPLAISSSSFPSSSTSPSSSSQSPSSISSQNSPDSRSQISQVSRASPPNCVNSTSEIKVTTSNTTKANTNPEIICNSRHNSSVDKSSSDGANNVLHNKLHLGASSKSSSTMTSLTVDTLSGHFNDSSPLHTSPSSSSPNVIASK